MEKLALVLMITSTILISSCFPSSLPLFSMSQTTVTNEQTETKDAKAYNTVYCSIFQKMKDEMNAAPNTGNVNLDFVLEMTPHHVGGIEMAKAILEYGNNADVKKIAQNIVTSQEAQLPIMQDLAMEFEKDAPSSKKASKKYMKSYNKIKACMFDEMGSVPLSDDDADITFLKQMIYHHEGAIAMSKNILCYTKNEALIKLANNIIETQSKGVEEMKSLVKTLEPAK